jgi:hypothetical protein
MSIVSSSGLTFARTLSAVITPVDEQPANIKPSVIATPTHRKRLVDM